MALTADDNVIHYVVKIEPPKITITYRKLYTGEIKTDIEPHICRLNEKGEYELQYEDVYIPGYMSCYYDINGQNVCALGDIVTSDLDIFIY